MANCYDDKQVVLPVPSTRNRRLIIPKLRDSRVAYGDNRVLAKRFAKWLYANVSADFYARLKEEL